MPAQFFSFRRVRAAIATLLVATLGALLPSVTSAEPASAAEPGRVFLVGSEAEIRGLPMSGSGWSGLVARADRALVPNLADQDNQSPAYAVAAGLVFVRSGNVAYRDKVVAALRVLPGTELNTGSRVLALGRQLAGWVLAADLVGYRDPGFVAWVDRVRTSVIGGHGRWVALSQTHEATSSNWGAFAGASRVAASLYVGDTADVARAARVLRGFLGDGGSWPTLSVGAKGEGFLPTADFDPSWACVYPGWEATNGPCGDRGGALVEDISRGEAYPNATQIGLSYSWEALQGATLQAVLLGRNGFPDVWEWQGSALRRAVQFLADHRGLESTNFHSINHWVTRAVDQVYGTSFSSGPALHGRNFGYTDWLPVTPTAAAPRPPEVFTRCEGAPEAPFADVPAANTHAATIACAAFLGLVDGTAPGQFAPALAVTRGQLASLVYRLLDAAGRLPAATPPDAFTDDETSVHRSAIDALAAMGIVSGTGPGRYDPGRPVTRGQLVSIFVRALDRGWASPLPAGPDAFDDDAGSVHEPATNAGAAAGLVAGVGYRRFAGDVDVRRDQAATFLVRLAHEVPA